MYLMAFAYRGRRLLHFMLDDDTEFRRATEQLRLAKEVAERATTAKSPEFLARVSYEIRTPLNAVLGYAVLALRDEIPMRARACLQNVHLAGQHLLDVVNDLLDLSKIEAGMLKLEKANLNIAELVRDGSPSSARTRARKDCCSRSMSHQMCLSSSWVTACVSCRFC